MLVAVGSNFPDNKKSEIFEDGNWRDIQEPQVDGALNRYAAIFYAGNFYYFGGYGGTGLLSSILRLNAASWTWSNVGQMSSPRVGHAVTLVENKFMLIGGSGIQPNEARTLDNDKFTCEEKPSSLTNYGWRPLLYVVNDSYGNC